RAGGEYRGEEQAVRTGSIGGGDFARVVCRGQPQQAGRTSAHARARGRVETVASPCHGIGPMVAGEKHTMAEPACDRGELAKARAPFRLAEMIMAKDEARAARQTGERLFQHSVIAL